jgi:hypothetical protein
MKWIIRIDIAGGTPFNLCTCVDLFALVAAIELLCGPGVENPIAVTVIPIAEPPA